MAFTGHLFKQTKHFWHRLGNIAGWISFWALKKRYKNTGRHWLKPIYELADRQYTAGADAISIYQSERQSRRDYLKPMIKEIGHKKIVAQRVKSLDDPDYPDGYPMGMDWNTKPKKLSVDIKKVSHHYYAL